MVIQKVLGLAALRRIIDWIKFLADRYIIREYLSGGEELSIMKLFSLKYLSNLTLHNLLGFAFIASFTFLTFPIGVWIASFPLATTIPLSRMVGLGWTMIFLPFELKSAQLLLGEFGFNRDVILGLVIVEFGLAISILGWLLVHRSVNV